MGFLRFDQIMNKMTEATVEPTMSKEDEAYAHARTLQGLADVEAGRFISVEQARENMRAFIEDQKRPA